MRIVDIPSPCPMKTSAMTPVNGGYYCGTCEKVVIDFSNLTNEEIIERLSARVGQKTCGIYKPENVVKRKVQSGLVRFAAAILLAFGAFLFTSCGDEECSRKIGDSLLAIEQYMIRKADSTSAADSIADAIAKQQDTTSQATPRSSNSK